MVAAPDVVAVRVTLNFVYVGSMTPPTAEADNFRGRSGLNDPETSQQRACDGLVLLWQVETVNSFRT